MEIIPDLEVSVSYDGPGMASAFRQDFKGKSTVRKVEGSLALLDSMQIPFAVMTVASSATIGHEHDIVDAVAKYRNVHTLKVMPCFDYAVIQSETGAGFRAPGTVDLLKKSTGSPPWAITPLEYNQIILACAERWIREGHFSRFILEPFTSILASAGGGQGGYTDFSSKKQPFVVTLSATGTVSTSDEFESDVALIGHVNDLAGTLVDQIRTVPNRLWKDCESLMQTCSSCSHKDVCHGGGLPDRLAFAPSRRLSSDYCGARRDLIDAVLEMASNN